MCIYSSLITSVQSVFLNLIAFSLFHRYTINNYIVYQHNPTQLNVQIGAIKKRYMIDIQS